MCLSCSPTTAHGPTGIFTPSPLPALGIPVSVLGTGFLASHAVLAAPSMSDLLGLVHGVRMEPEFDQCNEPAQFHSGIPRACGTDIHDPGDALLISATVLQACVRPRSITGSASRRQRVWRRGQICRDHTPGPVMVGTDRWTDESLGCPRVGQTYNVRDAKGLVILLAWPGQLTSAAEYHVTGHTVVYCGLTAWQ